MTDTTRAAVERLMDAVTQAREHAARQWEQDAPFNADEAYRIQVDARDVSALLARAEAAERERDALTKISADAERVAKWEKDRAEAAEAAARIAIAERDAERETVARLTEALDRAIAYGESADKSLHAAINEHRDDVLDYWEAKELTAIKTARAALTQKDRTDG